MEDGSRTYNGIPQPDEWPPELEYDGSRQSMPVPYLDAPPEVIPIDVGRQLFVDDFLIETTTLTRRFHYPEKSEHNPVLRPETEVELDGGECPIAAPFNDGVWWDPTDRLFKMWYQAGWMRSTGYAVSEDGIEWHRPELDVVQGTNIILAPRAGYRRDGCCVWLDHETEDPDQRFKMFQYFRSSAAAFGSPPTSRSSPGRREVGEPWSGGEVYTSPDGIHWRGPTRTGLLGDNSTFFYNPFRKRWVYSIRTASPRRITGVRTRAYREHSDFLQGSQWDDDEPVIWAWSDELDVPDPQIGEVPQLYDLNAVAYESIMLGLIAIFRGPPNPVAAEKGVPKTNDLMLGFSRDGFHWDRPTREPFIPATRTQGTWDKGYIHAAGGDMPDRRRQPLLLLWRLVRGVAQTQREHGGFVSYGQRHVRRRQHRLRGLEEGRVCLDGRGTGRGFPHDQARYLRWAAPVRQRRHLRGCLTRRGAGQPRCRGGTLLR